MTNKEALKAKCTRICSAFYADGIVLVDALLDAGIKPEDDAQPNNTEIVRLAISLASGFVESGRGEGGVSVSVDRDAVRANIMTWCRQYGLDASEFVQSITTIENGSDFW